MAIRARIATDQNFVQLQNPINLTADTTSAAVDMQGYQDLTILVNAGTSTDTLNGTNFWTLEVQQSNDNSTWTACADTEVSISETGVTTGTMKKIAAAGDLNKRYIVGYKGTSRYVRINFNSNGTTTNGLVFSATAIQGSAAKRAVA